MKKKYRFFNSFSFRLTLMILLSVIPPMLISFWVLKGEAEKYLYEDARLDLIHDGKDLAHFIEIWEQRIVNILLIIRELPGISSMEPQRQKDVVDKMRALFPEIEFSLVDLTGKPIVSTNADFTSEIKLLKLSERDWFKKIKAGEKVVSETVISPTTKQPNQCFAAGFSQDRTQALAGIALICIDLATIDEKLKLIGEGNQGRSFVINSQGTILADTQDFSTEQIPELVAYPAVAAALEGTTGFLSFPVPDGRTILANIIPVNDHLIVILEKDAQVVFGQVAVFNKLTKIIGLAAVIVIIILTWYLARQTTRPILKLTDATETMTGGNLDVRVSIARKDEIGSLGTTFNHMAEQLKNLIEKELQSAIARAELQKGREIQQHFLPSSIPQISGWEIATAFEPARQVSGDFYDAFRLENGDIGLVIADVCDKGVGAAMFMGLFRSFIRIFSEQTYLGTGSNLDGRYECKTTTDGQDCLLVDQEIEVGERIQSFDQNTLNRLKSIVLTNNYIATKHSDLVMFATIFFAILKPDTGMLYYINGGHEPVFILNSKGEIKQILKNTGSAVGIIPQSKFIVKQVQLEEEDILFGYTDGVTDARNSEKEFFGKERLQLLLEEPTTSATELLDTIKNNLFTFIGEAVQFDDITMLALRRNPENTHKYS